MRNEDRHILVTGGAGFIGSHTVEHLLERGFWVRVLDNLSTGKRDNLPRHECLSFIEGDINDSAVLTAAMQGISHCLHLAAQVSVVRSVEDPAGSAHQNILGCVNVMQAASQAGVEKLVYASSAAVYGLPEQLSLRETATLQPLSPYGLEKRVDELYAGLFQTLHGLPSLGLRYFNVFGPRQDPASPYAGVISKFFDCLMMNRTPTVFGDGGQTRDFIYVRDVARANVAALTSPHGGVCNVATGRRVDLLTLLDVLRDITGSTLPARHVAERAEDIRDSCGDPQRLHDWLGLRAEWSLESGLRALHTESRVARVTKRAEKTP